MALLKQCLRVRTGSMYSTDNVVPYFELIRAPRIVKSCLSFLRPLSSFNPHPSLSVSLLYPSCPPSLLLLLPLPLTLSSSHPPSLLPFLPPSLSPSLLSPQHQAPVRSLLYRQLYCLQRDHPVYRSVTLRLLSSHLLSLLTEEEEEPTGRKHYRFVFIV